MKDEIPYSSKEKKAFEKKIEASRLADQLNGNIEGIANTATTEGYDTFKKNLLSSARERYDEIQQKIENKKERGRSNINYSKYYTYLTLTTFIVSCTLFLFFPPAAAPMMTVFAALYFAPVIYKALSVLHKIPRILRNIIFPKKNPSKAIKEAFKDKKVHEKQRNMMALYVVKTQNEIKNKQKLKLFLVDRKDALTKSIDDLEKGKNSSSKNRKKERLISQRDAISKKLMPLVVKNLDKLNEQMPIQLKLLAGVNKEFKEKEADLLELMKDRNDKKWIEQQEIMLNKAYYNDEDKTEKKLISQIINDAYDFDNEIVGEKNTEILNENKQNAMPEEEEEEMLTERKKELIEKKIELIGKKKELERMEKAINNSLGLLGNTSNKYEGVDKQPIEHITSFTEPIIKRKSIKNKSNSHTAGGLSPRIDDPITSSRRR
jgi:hypothetical protein